MDLPKLILFWEIWGLSKHFYQKWIFHQSRTKTSTKTHIAKQSIKYPNHRLLVHNLHTTKQNKTKKQKREKSFRRLEGSALGQWLQVHLFFTFLFITISVSFAEKVNPWCLCSPFFLLFLVTPLST